MNYPELRPDIVEIFDEVQAFGAERFRAQGFRLIDRERVNEARRVLVDKRTRAGRGLPPAVVEPSRPGGQAWRGRPFVDQHGTRYTSTREAATRTGAKHTMIFAVLKGERKSTHGLTFRYV